MKVAFCSSEVVPFAKTGGMADVCGALPLALEELGIRVVILMPRYKCIVSRDHDIRALNNDVSTTTIGKDIQVYFIENEVFSGRDGLYGESNGDYPDNLERFQLYCFKALEVLKQLNIDVDIFHCHDWQAALIPVYLKFLLHKDSFYKDMKSVLSIHNLAYQGIFPKKAFPKLGLKQSLYRSGGFEFHDKINLLKAGILHSDAVATVSPGYAREIQTEDYGCGLDGVLRSRKDSIPGILNGLDNTVWNPQSDKLIAHRYSAQDIAGKYKNKAELQKQCKLPIRSDVPLFGFVGRLSYQKGIDLISEGMPTIARMDLQMVFLGVGDDKNHEIVKNMASRYPKKIAACLEFNEKLGHQIYAGSDIFLMPSVYEPCGLSQMISLRYGTVPLVHKTGGLKDTVTAYDRGGNGFVFTEYTPDAFVAAVKQAVDVYHDKSGFKRLVQKAFECHFSQTDSARQYRELYDQCLSSA